MKITQEDNVRVSEDKEATLGRGSGTASLRR